MNLTHSNESTREESRARLKGLMDTNITTTKFLKGSSKLGSLDTAKAPLRSLIWT